MSPQDDSYHKTHSSRQICLLNITIVVIAGLLRQQHTGEHFLARLVIHISLKSKERL